MKLIYNGAVLMELKESSKCVDGKCEWILVKYPASANHPVGALVNDSNDLLSYLKRRIGKRPDSVKVLAERMHMDEQEVVNKIEQNDIKMIAKMAEGTTATDSVVVVP